MENCRKLSDGSQKQIYLMLQSIDNNNNAIYLKIDLNSPEDSLGWVKPKTTYLLILYFE